MKKSAFKEWFREQFGSLPNEPKRVKLTIKVHELESALVFARKELDRENWLRDAQDAALKGWNASPGKIT